MPAHDTYPDALLRDIFASVRVIAVVGASANPARPSHRVLRFLLSRGYDAVAVNPNFGGSFPGARTVARLADIGAPIDMVDVFRNAAAVDRVVDEVLALDRLPAVLWMQLGIRVEAAAARAEAKGIRVVMNRCPAIEIPRLGASDSAGSCRRFRPTVQRGGLKDGR